MTTDPNVLYNRSFETSPNRSASVEVRHHSIDIGEHHFESVDLSVSSAIFGDLNQAEQYANSILEAVAVARTKRDEVGIGVDGNPVVNQENVIPIYRERSFPLSPVQLKILRFLNKPEYCIEHIHARKYPKQQERIWLLSEGVFFRNVHSKTFDRLRRGKYIVRMKSPKNTQGRRTYYVISTKGREAVQEHGEEPQPL